MNSQTGSATIIPFSAVAGAKLDFTNPFVSNPDSYHENSYSTNLFDALWTSARNGMRVTDANGIILAVNKSFCDLVEMREDELLGKPFTVIYPLAQDRIRLLSTYQMIFATGMYQTVFEFCLDLSSGKKIEIETNATVVEFDRGIKALLTQFRDITEQRKVELLSQENEARYKRLFVDSIQPMFESSVVGKIINANKSFLRLLGYQTSEEICDLNISKDIYVHSEIHNDLMTVLETRGYICNIELQLKRKNGKIITVVENAHAIYNDKGKMIGIEGAVEDVTTKKNLEQRLHRSMQALEESRRNLSELNAQKNKLLSILSHDLRSPFASILGFCEILLEEIETLPTKEQTQFIGFIREAAQEQLAIVNNLLNWTKVESRQLIINLQEIDLHDLVRKSITSLYGLAYQKGIHLLNNIRRNTFIMGDHQLLIQLFTNIIGNALKFTPSGGEINVDLQEGETDQWIIAIRDTGIGIPENDIPKLFKIGEKYTRVGLHGEFGTGLGLPICQELINIHRGSISAKSVIGQGTSFIIQLPKISI